MCLTRESGNLINFAECSLLFPCTAVSFETICTPSRVYPDTHDPHFVSMPRCHAQVQASHFQQHLLHGSSVLSDSAVILTSVYAFILTFRGFGHKATPVRGG